MSYVDPILEKRALESLKPQEIHDALGLHYARMTKFVEGVAKDKWHLIVNGPAGVGKTEVVNSVLKNKSLVKLRPNFISGTISAVRLFELLHKHRKREQITVIDDTDKILEDTECLELLKAALDTQNKSINWTKFSTALGKTNTPDEFTYEGRIIIITNKLLRTVENANPTRHQQQLLPLMSRCMYFRAGLPMSWRIHALRYFHKIGEIRIFDESGVSKESQNEILDFIEKYQDDLREVSFRTLVLLVSLKNEEPDFWEEMALASLGH
jgi:hypothetical protein